MQNPQPGSRLQKPLERQFERLTEPLNRFVANQVSGAILLLLATFAALVFANTGLQAYYQHLGEIEAGVFFQDFELRKTLHHWVNEGLMVLFFFLLGLEIKREFLVGELRSLRQSSTVLMAAAGGMLAPAIIYAGFNHGGVGEPGWGIPMATDAAFALGAMALLGKRIPTGLKVFLVALAIVDDIGAILVIAIFYTSELQLDKLVIGGVLLGMLMLLNRLGIRVALPYLLVSIGLWYAILLSGIHATVAGVLAALAIPARPRLHPHHVARKLRLAADRMEMIDKHNPDDQLLADRKKHDLLEGVEQRARDTRTPLRTWETHMARPVSLLVIPVFAFLNAGITLSFATFGELQSSSVALGVIAGLVLGKPLGIVLLAWVNVKLGWGDLPRGVGLAHLLGLGLLAGMGFTMSIFIAALSFGAGVELLNQAKASIMLATSIAGLVGIAWLWFLSLGKKAPEN